jgi:hypothetical protein
MANRITDVIIAAPPRPREFDITGVSGGFFEINGQITAGNLFFRISADGVNFSAKPFFSFVSNGQKASLAAPFSGSERGAFDLAGNTKLRIVTSPDFAGSVSVDLTFGAAAAPDPTAPGG